MSEWKVLHHGAWEQLAPNLWQISGSLPNMALPRNLVVVRIGGDLLLHSVICLDEARMAELESFGKLRWMLVPNEGHRLDAPAFKRRYPDLQVIAPRNARAKVAEKVPVDADCEDALPPLGIRIHRPDGMKDGYELVYEVDLDGGGKALIVNDVLTNPIAVPGVGGAILGLLGPPGKKLGQPRIVRFFFGKDRAAFRGFVAKLASIDGVRVVTTSHGAPITSDCSAALNDAASRL